MTQIVITRTESPTFQGASFGDTGPYEKLVARATGEIDPRDPRNAVITDIMLAPRNARGMVEPSDADRFMSTSSFTSKAPGLDPYCRRTLSLDQQPRHSVC